MTRLIHLLQSIILLSLSFMYTQVYAADASSDATPASYQPTVLITGSNRGIGFEFVRQYAAAGWRVIATARSPDKADDLKLLAANNENIVIEQLDVVDLESVDALAQKYSGQAIDVLLNNAGLSGSPSPQQLFGRVDYDKFDAFMLTNARGPLKVSEAFLPHVRASQQKRIINISSLAGSFSHGGRTASGTMVYRSSKAALNMIMVNVADSVRKHDVTVLMINPGLVDTQGILSNLNEKMNLGLNITLIEDSVAGMMGIIDGSVLEDSGRFIQWSGEDVGF
jgi:NAD(P)-dependent dehydrogenase (short-subunit alcohol dehydrogenase family)